MIFFAIRSINWAHNCECCFSFCLHCLIDSSNSILDNKCQPLLTFSAYTNGIQLFSYDNTQSPNIIQCINGIRSITTIWIIISHSYYVFFFLPSREHLEFIKVVINSLIFIIAVSSTRRWIDSMNWKLIWSHNIHLLNDFNI